MTQDVKFINDIERTNFEKQIKNDVVIDNNNVRIKRNWQLKYSEC